MCRSVLPQIALLSGLLLGLVEPIGGHSQAGSEAYLSVTDTSLLRVASSPTGTATRMSMPPETLFQRSSRKATELIAQNQATSKGYIQIKSTRISPAAISRSALSGPTCAIATVQVLVSRGSPGSDPSVTLSLAKYSTMPPGMEVGIALLSPNPLERRITGDSGDYTFNVCADRGTGKVVLHADINNWNPMSDFNRREPDSDVNDARIAVEVKP
jgi:hypothetical protein